MLRFNEYTKSNKLHKASDLNTHFVFPIFFIVTSYQSVIPLNLYKLPLVCIKVPSPFSFFLTFISRLDYHKMIDSILSGRRRSSQTTSIAAVSIEILPEFGWSIGDERLFGPGTLFQGKHS